MLFHLEDRPDWSYADLIETTSRLSRFLSTEGLRPGDRVLVQAEKSPESIALYLACLQRGLIYVPINTAYTERELSYFIADAEPKLLVVGNATKQIATDIQSYCLNAAGQGSLMDRANEQQALTTIVARQEDDVAAILYTSGTTGRSKGAMITHRNLLSNARVLNRAWRFTEADVLLHALPIYHVHGLFVATHCVLLSGASMIWQTRFDIDRLLDQIPHATVLMGVPTFYFRMINSRRLNKDLVKSMRLFISGSAPLSAQVFQEFESMTGMQVLERYGMSETLMNTSNPYEVERIPGTVGFALPGVEVRIRKAGNEANLVNENGSIELRGPNVFRGYWHMPEKTQAAFTADGFFITGDLGRIDDEGRLSIVGRDKDLVISGGLNVYPAEVETVIDQIAGIAESAIIGAHHDDFGEAVVAIVVSQNEIQLETITTYLTGRLAKFKHPKALVRLNELPKNVMGKVQKNVLREQYGNLFNETE